MGIGATLQNLINQKGTNVNELSKKINVTPSTIYSIIKRDNLKVDFGILIKIADELGVTVDYFYNEKRKSEPIFDMKELSIINNYRRLDPHGKEAVDSALKIEIKRIDDEQRKREEHLKAQETAKKKATNKIVEMPEQKIWVLPSYDIASSAGTGTIFDESECTPMVLKSEPPYGAAFVIPITGDSMTPKFHDGDYVFVRPQPLVEIGQIGVFYHDGASYIKKLGDGELISLNPEYPNIKIDEYTHCFGRVLGVVK